MRADEPPVELEAGKTLSHFELVEKIGAGGMGVVFEARDLRLGRTVAIKVLSRDLLESETARWRFLREGRLTASLDHPNIATIHQIDEADGALFIVMELVRGQTLKERIQEGPLSLPQVIAIGRQACDALETAHRRGIVHRDVKSSNIMVTPEGQVKILDFGLAKARELGAAPRDEGDPTRVLGQEDQAALLDSQFTESGIAVGTPSYMSPEQARGEPVDARSDLFSLGVVLYEAASGELPFPGTSQREILEAVRSKEPTPAHVVRQNVPAEFSRVLSRCLAKRREERYRSASELKGDLERLTGARRITRRLVAGAALLGVLGAVSYGLFAPAGSPPERSVAVLPLAYSGDPSREFLASMVTDALIAALQSIPGLATAPYETVQLFREEPRDDEGRIAEIRRLLGVQSLALGSVRVEGEEIEIRLRLSSASGAISWEKTVSGALARPLPAVEALKEGLAAQLLQERGPPGPSLASLRTPSEAAYQRYLEAKDHYERWDLESDLEEAVSAFREAVSMDPSFAAAHAGLARALVTLFYQTNEPALIAEATEAVERAGVLAPDLPEVLLASGFLYEVTGETTEAERALRRAILLAPGYDTAYRVTASFYADLGRHREAEELYQRALALRPGSWRIQYDAGRYQLVFRGDLEAAREHMERAEELHPSGDGPKQVLGLIDLKQGRLEDAEARFGTVLRRSPADTMARYNLGWVEYYRGRFELALKYWREALERSPEQPMYEAAVADALRNLGEEEEASVHYSRALELYREMLEQHPGDGEKQAELATLLPAVGGCAEAQEILETVLDANPESFEFTTRGAYVYHRCGSEEEAVRLALESISRGDIARIRFDPDLENLRESPEVRTALLSAED